MSITHNGKAIIKGICNAYDRGWEDGFENKVTPRQNALSLGENFAYILGYEEGTKCREDDGVLFDPIGLHRHLQSYAVGPIQ